MKIIKRSSRTAPKVSLILLDWSVRESFHLLHYLSKQNVNRDKFEVIVVEFYSRESEAVRKFEEQVDSWVLLEMPDDCYYHKHLMYNAGIVLASGEIVVICDSDAMVRETFISSIIGEFEKDPNIVLHLDQFRNVRPDFHPFNYPSFDEVTGKGCINNVGGKTKGLVDIKDPIHTKNYGACMAALRSDLVSIGGADEHIDYLGHICGPYEMTFRLINQGKREVWHQSEFIYHTWHPGQAGMDNRLGPHDGMHMSTTALESLISRRVMPLIENPAIHMLGDGEGQTSEELIKLIITKTLVDGWNYKNRRLFIKKLKSIRQSRFIETYRGFRIEKASSRYEAKLFADLHQNSADDINFYYIENSLGMIKKKINGLISVAIALSLKVGAVYLFFTRIVEVLGNRIKRFSSSLVKNGADSLTNELAVANQTPSQLILGRVPQLMADIRGRYDSLSSLIVNLHLLREKTVFENGEGVPVMLIHDNWMKYYLEFLSSSKLLPKVKIIHIQDTVELNDYLTSSEFKSLPDKLMVSKDLYTRQHLAMDMYGIKNQAFIF